MATFQTYGQLKTQFFSWINRDDLDGNVPGFIALIEADLKRRIHILDLKMEDNAFDVDGETVTLPVPCRDIINFYHNTDGALIRRVAVDEAAIDGNYLGKPREYYVLDSTSLRVAPPPDQTYSTTIYYNAEFTPLEDDADTNPILLTAPDIYLNGLMAYGCKFIEDDERAAKHLAIYNNAIDEHQLADVKSRYSGPLAPKLRNVV